MKHSQKFIQRRKFVMVLPLLVLPFLTMIFWALGGGQGTPVQAMSFEKTGLNLELPDAHFNDEEWNKLALYEKAERDSLKSREARENDPYFNFSTLTEKMQGGQQEPVLKEESQDTPRSLRSSFPGQQKEAIDPNEAKVNQKLEQLYRELNKAPEHTFEQKKEKQITPSPASPQISSDVEKLEQMMEMMHSGSQADPEMQQIEGMLEKILDIQHPDRVREKIREQSEQKKGQVFPVETSRSEDNVTLISPPNQLNQTPADNLPLQSKGFSPPARQNSFYSLEDEVQGEQQTGSAIEAVIHDTQELVAGSTVKMRLLNDVYINGQFIPEAQFVYGTASINDERLTVEINSIRNGNSLLPVSLSAYDLDGIEGIYIPGAITRDAAKESSDQAMQSLQFLSMDQSLSAQAASAGLQAAKGLFSKKAKMIKVTVKAGYQVLLKDGNARS